MQHLDSKAPHYDNSEVLGCGTFAIVFGADQGKAVKRIEIHRTDKELLVREETAMRKMDHPNVLKLFDAKEDENFKYLVLERCMGTVRDYICGDKKFSNKQLDSQMPPEVEALRQMTRGLAYIHAQDVVHRDVKPENVLISDKFVLKISDFGCCKPTAPDGSMSATSGPKGTRAYYAPEYLQIVKKGISVHLFATPGKTFKFRESYESDVTNNILDNKKFIEENGIPSGHYAFEMIDGMTQAHSKDRWVLDESESGTNSVLNTLNKELQREEKK